MEEERREREEEYEENADYLREVQVDDNEADWSIKIIYECNQCSSLIEFSEKIDKYIQNYSSEDNLGDSTIFIESSSVDYKK